MTTKYTQEELVAIHEKIQKLETKLFKRLVLEDDIDELQELLPTDWDAVDEYRRLYDAGAVSKYVKYLRSNLSIEQTNLKNRNKE